MKVPFDGPLASVSRLGGAAPSIDPPATPASTSTMPFDHLSPLLNPQLAFRASRAQGITLVSPAWLSYTGQTQQQAQGWSFTHFIHPDDLAKFIAVPGPAPAAPPSSSAARAGPATTSHSAQSSKATFASDITLQGQERSPLLDIHNASPPRPSKWLGQEIAGMPDFSPSTKTAAAIQAKLLSEGDVAATKAEFKHLSSSFTPSRFWSAVGAPDISSTLMDKTRPSASGAMALDFPDVKYQLADCMEGGLLPRPRTLERTISELSLAAKLPLPPSPGVDRESYLEPIGEGLGGQELPTFLKTWLRPINELVEGQILKLASDGTGKFVYTAEVRLLSHTGEYRWHSIRCSPSDLFGPDGRSASWTGTCTDIHEHKMLERELTRAMESKSRFLSNMSHEIRTPLIGITGMVHFLLDTSLNEEQMDFCDTIMTSSRGLLLVINDILDLSKVEAGMMTLAMGWFHIRSLIEDVNEILSPLARDKRLELNYVIDEDVPAMVKGDRLRIRQVLLNVIGNALKFTTTGEVFSHCKVHRGGEETTKANEVVISYEVIDTGRGFSEEQAKLMFKPFSQIDFDGGSTPAYGGSGLGLVISRQLVELHGGSMHAFSTPEKGSTFDFTAKFLLPSGDDFPNPDVLEEEYRLHELTTFPPFSSQTTGKSRRVLESDPNSPLIASMLSQSPAGSPSVRRAWDSPGLASSSASSDPSLRSANTIRSDLSSASSILPAVTPLVQQAIAANMKDITLALPGPVPRDETSATLISAVSPATITLPSTGSESSLQSQALLRPPMYSIMVVCPYSYAREAIVQHIEMTLSKDIPHQITAQASLSESREMIGREDPVLFTHIVLNLNETGEVVDMMDHIAGSPTLPSTCVVIICDPTQRAEIMRESSGREFEAMSKTSRVQFIYKPVKPSRFSAIFDPAKERALSSDRNRSTAQRVAENQKQVFIDMEKLVGHRGYRVLLVEDNPVNQKVILKFLSKVGLAVDAAIDGVEGTEKVMSKEPGYYSVVLCDLHMPRKDGYQTCREIRQWETENQYARMPIIALSANVMADVVEKCVQAGFNNYVTKPVDFGELSRSISEMLASSSSSVVEPGNSPAA